VATLTFLVAAVSSIARYFESAGTGVTKENWSSDVIQLSVAYSILGSFSFAVPIIIYGMLRHVGNPKEFVEILSLYGYSLTVYVPCVFLFAIPSSVWRWIILLLSSSVSIAFLVLNLWLKSESGWSSPRSGNGIPCLGVIVSAQVILALVLKFYYFTFTR